MVRNKEAWQNSRCKKVYFIIIDITEFLRFLRILPVFYIYYVTPLCNSLISFRWLLSLSPIAENVFKCLSIKQRFKILMTPYCVILLL